MGRMVHQLSSQAISTVENSSLYLLSEKDLSLTQYPLEVSGCRVQPILKGQDRASLTLED